MTTSQVVVDLVALVEDFKKCNPTKRARNAAAFELYRDAINIGDGDENLFTTLGSTDNLLILETFMEYGSGISEEEIAETIAGNQNAPVTILDTLKKESYKVQMALLSNPTTSKDILIYLSRYGKLSSIKTAAKSLLDRRKGRAKSEIEQLAKGEETFSLKENPHLVIPSDSVFKIEMLEFDYRWFVGGEFPKSRTNYLIKYGQKTYLGCLDMSTPKTYVILFVEIEKVSEGEYKVIKLLNKYFNLDEL